MLPTISKRYNGLPTLTQRSHPILVNTKIKFQNSLRSITLRIIKKTSFLKKFLFPYFLALFIVPAVVSLNPHSKDQTSDGLTFTEACRKLEESGADVVGLNCGRGPKTMMPLIREIRKVCKVGIIIL